MLGDWGWHDGMGAGGWVMMTVLWIALVAVVAWAVAQLFGGPRREREPERPEEILARRLASGEIDPETYESLHDRLRARA